MNRNTRNDTGTVTVLAAVALALGYTAMTEQEVSTLHHKWNDIQPAMAHEVIHAISKVLAKREHAQNLPQYVLVRIFADRLTWAVRIVQKGELYGLRNCLMHVKEEPLVEFYDTRFPHTHLGQFVSRYPISTMIGTHPYGHGLCLDGGVPDWTISDACFGKIQDWLMSLDLLPHKEFEYV